MNHTPGDLTISKRLPPSRRPERQLDETAKAIARAVEDEKAEKSAESKSNQGPETPKTYASAAGTLPTNFRTAGGVAPTISTKRPKSPGG